MSIPLEEIEDIELRTTLETLELEIPHIQSVVNPTIAEFSVPLYHKLLAMEAYTYEKSEQPESIDNEVPSEIKAGVVQYTSYWLTYIENLMTYIDHTPIPNQRIKDLVVGIYCFMGVHTSRGFGNLSDLLAANAKDIFVMNGYLDTVLGYPIEYFDDYSPEDLGAEPVPPAEPPEPIPESANNLTADSELVLELWEPDAAKVDVLISKFADVVSDATVNALFTAPVEPEESLSASGVWDKIMVELNWQWYIDFFGSTVNIPPRPDF